LKTYFLSLLLFVSGCATVVKQQVALQPVESAEILSVNHTITIRLDTGINRTIKAGSKWKYTGNVNSGKVYKPVDDVFSIEGTQQYEAYLVISGGRIVGFYLPASSNFSPLTKQVVFP
jgi:hypothetical protein